MSEPVPDLLALDFDGVICDGLLEYFQTTCRAYQQIWPEDDTLLTNFAPRFYALRPVIETGWEMPILLRELVLGQGDEAIFEDWPTLLRQRVAEEHLDPKAIAHSVDSVRDHWIHRNLEEWLGLHRFYEGVLEQLRQILAAGTPQLYIVTTKEGRFVQRLLAQGGVNLPATAIFGKEVKRPKPETLQQLRAASPLPSPRLWFVEDRLKALEDVAAHPALGDVELFLADWGYNTAATRTKVAQDPKIRLLSLLQFRQSWSAW